MKAHLSFAKTCLLWMYFKFFPLFVFSSWVLYEKPDFKGEKIALDEEDIELTNPFGPPEEEEAPLENGTAQDQEDEEPKPQMKKTFVIGSIRRAVRV